MLGGGALLVVAAVVVTLLASGYPRGVKLLVRGDVHELRPNASHHRSGPNPPHLFVLAIDGLDRRLLYELLRSGELPNLAKLFGGGKGGGFEHACFYDRALTVLPSTTIAAWTTAFTGVAPGEHGIPGNEFFIRERRELVAPAPVSVSDISPTLAVYTEDTLGRLLEVPTVYEQLRRTDPALRIWVAMSQVYRGADKLILAKRQVLAGAFEAFLRDTLGDETSRGVYASLDEEVIESLNEEFKAAKDVPDVVTLYVAGTDLFAHHAQSGPDSARRAYLREVLDPSLAPLLETMKSDGFLDDAWVIVLSDHGHTDVLHDDAHALSTEGSDEPPEVLRRAGFRVRPFQWHVEDSNDYQTVLAYNGAMAFVYAADRSSCTAEGERCDWSRPARFEGDVLPIAAAFTRANESGEGVKALKGVLDLILVRNPDGAGYGVYTVDGRVVSIASYLERHPHPHYVELESRLTSLATGPHGNRAGDVVLIANNGNVDTAAQRYYFATQYRSWHGSPSKRDGEIPFIVSHPARSSDDIRSLVDQAMGDSPGIAGLTPLMLRLLHQRP